MDNLACPSCNTALPKRPAWYLPKDSEIRTHALKIMAMRLSGLEDKEIGTVLGLNQQTIYNYMYRAGKNGYLDYYNAEDAIAYGLMPKVIQNLHDGLDDDVRNDNTGLMVKTLVAMKIAEGTVFKKYDTANRAEAPLMMIGVKIEMPEGAVPQAREGTTGGTPAYVEADVEVVE